MERSNKGMFLKSLTMNSNIQLGNTDANGKFRDTFGNKKRDGSQKMRRDMIDFDQDLNQIEIEFENTHISNFS